jgi:T-complex protein 1 subunit eta
MNNHFNTSEEPKFIILREGTAESFGRSQLITNINACLAVADTLRSTLGPRGMDKFIVDSNGESTISNDGATILKKLEIIHPAAKTLVDIAISQDSEVGDGTTGVVLFAAELLKEAKRFVEEGVHTRVIIKAFRSACHLAITRVRELSISISYHGEINRLFLEKCAMTSLNSKLISGEKNFFANMAVDAVSKLDSPLLDLSMIGIKKVQGGSITDSIYIDGVAFKKTFSYAGYEQQPKKFLKPTILLINVELELKAEKDNAEIRMNEPEQYQSIVDAEWEIIYSKLNNCSATGAKIVLSRLAIGDLATQYFADNGIFCAGRVAEEDLARTAKATGAQVQSTVNNLDKSVLGFCGLFEEKNIGKERYNIFTGCKNSSTATIILRGSSEQYMDEVSRSLHDAIMIVRRMLKNPQFVPGGGAIEMDVSKYIHDESRTIMGKRQIFFRSFAKALEIIPRQLCDNAGFDSSDILNLLRQKHNLSDGQRFGVDMNSGGICDTYNSFVLEPSIVKINALSSATEVASLILSIDESIINPQSEQSES